MGNSGTSGARPYAVQNCGFLSILVNSSDGFEDCWAPFFKLFSAQWPNCPYPIFLNTETKKWSFPGLPVQCTRVQAAVSAQDKMSWSACLMAALDQIESPLVLYFQEDYFLQAPVRVDVVEALASKMMERPEIRHIGMTHFGARGPFAPTSDERLWEISRRSRYRISTQAGLWRKDTLRSYLRSEENGWMFEILGTLRARRRDDLFLTVNRDKYGPGQRVIDYLHTGIIKGRWHPDIPSVFRQFDIEVDYGRRGFYKQPSWLARKIETGSTLLRHPAALLRGLLVR